MSDLLRITSLSCLPKLRLLLIGFVAVLLPRGACAEPVRLVAFGDMPYCRQG